MENKLTENILQYTPFVIPEALAEVSQKQKRDSLVASLLEDNKKAT